MGKPKVQFRTGQISHASPKTSEFSEYLQEALTGGTPTADFFKGDFGALQEISEMMHKKGKDAWKSYKKGSETPYKFTDPDLPVQVAKGSKGTMVVQFHPSTEVMGKKTTEYKQAGIATAYLVTDKGTFDVIIAYVEKLGPAVAGVALAPAISAILGSLKTYFQSFLSKAFGAAEDGATDAGAVADEAAADAAEEAAVDGEVIADELALSVSFGPLAIAGIVVAAITLVVCAILFFLSKTMTCFIKFYNYTDVEFKLDLCYKYDLKVQQEPKTGKIPGVGVPPAPPGVKALDKVIYRADYILLNSNDLKGLGAVIKADGDPTKPDTFPGLTAMFDIPSVGDNSLYSCVGSSE